MKFVVALLITAFAALTVAAQAPTLHIVTEIPGLPSELFYGNIKVKPLRLRPGTTTPITINDSDFFVSQQYVDFLSRFADQTGMNHWTGQITNCGNDAGCIDFQRANTSGAFFLSIEFQQTGYLVERMYKAAYGDANATSSLGEPAGTTHPLSVPILRRSEFLPDTLALSNGVVVNQGDWQTKLENNKVAYANDFVSRSRFTNAYPASMSTVDFVNALNTHAGNPLSSSEATQLANSGKTRAEIVRAVAEDPDFVGAEKNRAFVLMQYLGYLRRDPNSGPDADYKGYEFWLKKLNDFGGDFNSAEMVRAFIVSKEYLDRF